MPDQSGPTNPSPQSEREMVTMFPEPLKLKDCEAVLNDPDLSAAYYVFVTGEHEGPLFVFGFTRSMHNEELDRQGLEFVTTKAAFLTDLEVSLEIPRVIYGAASRAFYANANLDFLELNS